MSDVLDSTLNQFSLLDNFFNTISTTNLVFFAFTAGRMMAQLIKKFIAQTTVNSIDTSIDQYVKGDNV